MWQSVLLFATWLHHEPFVDGYRPAVFMKMLPIILPALLIMGFRRKRSMQWSRRFNAAN